MDWDFHRAWCYHTEPSVEPFGDGLVTPARRFEGGTMKPGEGLVLSAGNSRLWILVSLPSLPFVGCRRRDGSLREAVEGH